LTVSVSARQTTARTRSNPTWRGDITGTGGAWSVGGAAAVIIGS
jgi:hypothetical protein